MPYPRVYIRDIDYQIVDELDVWNSMTLVIRQNDTGTWTLDVPATDDQGNPTFAAQLLTQAAGIVVRLDGVTIFSGSVLTELRKTVTTLSIGGLDDNILLEEPARPTPSLSEGPYPDAYDVRTGLASSVLVSYVYYNIGPGAPAACKIPQLLLANDPLLGSTLTGRAYFELLRALLAGLASTPQAGGLNFRILQSDADQTKLVFTVWASEDRTDEAKFGVKLGTASDYEDTWSFPPANYWVVLGGDGFGANRTVVEGGDSAAITAAGRRITGVYDARGITDPSELEQKLGELLAGAIATRKTTITPFSVASLEFGTDWNFGDLVTVVVDGEAREEVIRDVQIELTNNRGMIVTPMIGEAGTGNDEQTANHLKTVQDRISNLERNYNVPPDSIDRSMLVPVLKPPIGEVKWLAGSSVPDGYLAANGASYLRSAYPDLFAAIGATWGAADGTHFNVPDLRDRSPIGSGSTYTLGQLVGSATATIGTHTHTGAAHTHPGSHSHGLSNHTHAGQTHTHPGSHSHGLAAHRHQMGHDHTVNINHDHGSFSSGLRNNDTVGALGFDEPNVSSGTEDHHHNVDVPALGTTNITSSNSNNTVTGDGEKTSGGAAFTSTDTDSNVFAASYSGSPSAPSTNTSDSDSNVFSASFSGQTGSAGGSTTSIVHPSAGLLAVIYAGQ